MFRLQLLNDNQVPVFSIVKKIGDDDKKMSFLFSSFRNKRRTVVLPIMYPCQAGTEICADVKELLI